MLTNHEQAYADVDYTSPHEEEVSNLFKSEEDAIVALYEELFCSLSAVCPQTILNGMKYLIFNKSMYDQMEEMEHMQPCDVDVVHHREAEKTVDQATKEMKRKMYDFLEELQIK